MSEKEITILEDMQTLKEKSAGKNKLSIFIYSGIPIRVVSKIYDLLQTAKQGIDLVVLTKIPY